MVATQYYARPPNAPRGQREVPVSAADADYLSRALGYRVRAVVETAGGRA